jgi:hypothetical protein
MIANKFTHIYFNDWEVGAMYERNVKGSIVQLGTLVSKELVGRPYDQDIKLTFNNNGSETIHIMEFDQSYRKKY